MAFARDGWWTTSASTRSREWGPASPCRRFPWGALATLVLTGGGWIWRDELCESPISSPFACGLAGCIGGSNRARDFPRSPSGGVTPGGERWGLGHLVRGRTLRVPNILPLRVWTCWVHRRKHQGSGLPTISVGWCDARRGKMGTRTPRPGTNFASPQYPPPARVDLLGASEEAPGLGTSHDPRRVV
jgi:hypothetical protein